MMDLLDMDPIQYVIILGFWMPISAGIWRFWAKSESLGSVGFRLTAIIAMLFLITIIVNIMGD